jgi:hypothetical protein
VAWPSRLHLHVVVASMTGRNQSGRHALAASVQSPTVTLGGGGRHRLQRWGEGTARRNAWTPPAGRSCILSVKLLLSRMTPSARRRTSRTWSAVGKSVADVASATTPNYCLPSTSTRLSSTTYIIRSTKCEDVTVVDKDNDVKTECQRYHIVATLSTPTLFKGCTSTVKARLCHVACCREQIVTTSTPIAS